MIFVILGMTLLLTSRAAAPYVSLEPETSTDLHGNVAVINDSTASGGSAIKLSASTMPPPDPIAASRGVFVLMYANTTIPNDMLTNPNIDGFYFFINWGQVQPKATSQLNFGVYDSAFKLIAQHHKKISLGIRAGDKVPTWVYGPNARSVTMTMQRVFNPSACDTLTIPVPWDSGYKQKWESFVAQTATHFKQDPEVYNAIVRVKVTGVNSSTDETALPFSGDPGTGGCATTNAPIEWHKYGYTHQLITDTLKEFADTFHAQFTGKVVSYNIVSNHFPAEVDDAGTVTVPANQTTILKPVMDYIIPKYKSTLMGQTNGLTAKGGDTTPQTSVVKAAGGAIGFQMGYYVKGDERCQMKYGPGADPVHLAECDATVLQAAVDRGMAQLPNFLEIYTVDVAAFPSVIQNAHNALLR